MPTNRDLLLQLQPFTNSETIIVDDQNVVDIIDAIIETHDQYKDEYDKIYQYFIGSTPKDTANNIFKYLKKNVKYNIEPDNLQTVKSPSAIISTGNVGSDCKNYSLFVNGVLDAIRRNELESYDLYFRFASYDPMDQTPQHVFAVMIEDGKEIWIDPVLSFFNQKKEPYFYKDKKIKQMALIALAGITDPYENYYNNKTMGDPYGNYYNNKHIGDNTTALISAGAATGSNLLLPGSGLVVGALANLIGGLFGGNQGPTPTDWQGWDSLDVQYNKGQLGTQAAAHVLDILNGSDQNAQVDAQNILSWIASKGNNGLNLICTTFHTGHDLDGQTVTINQLISALQKAGLTTQATAIQNYYNQSIAPTTASTTATTTAGLSPIVLIGGAALLLILIK